MPRKGAVDIGAGLKIDRRSGRVDKNLAFRRQRFGRLGGRVQIGRVGEPVVPIGGRFEVELLNRQRLFGRLGPRLSAVGGNIEPHHRRSAIPFHLKWDIKNPRCEDNGVRVDRDRRNGEDGKQGPQRDRQCDAMAIQPAYRRPAAGCRRDERGAMIDRPDELAENAHRICRSRKKRVYLIFRFGKMKGQS
ncbi:hypothetical protein CKO51_07125 [Rhodopirellula sp. SM50]|nr:hypothetical protein CKO51_07125 [Rhodopirellula sp. SM50]